MFATTFEIAQNTLEPPIVFNPLAKWKSARFDGTGILAARFFMQKLNDDGTLGAMKITAGPMTIVSLNPFQASYAWAGTDTNTIGLYTSWIVGYKGAGLTDPQVIDGVDILIYVPGTRRAH